jgi:signal transduction histidine kinase
MSPLEAGEASEAAHGNSDLQKELAEVLRQRAAISAVLRAIANSPHELQPIFDTIIDSATRVGPAQVGALRLCEEEGLRLVAWKRDSDVLMGPPPTLLGYNNQIHPHLIASKSPLQIPDLAAHEAYLRRGDAYIVDLVEVLGIRTLLLAPMLKDDHVIGVISIARNQMQPFTDKQISMFMDFASQATIALESTRRERQHRQMAMELAHANRIATTGQLAASIAHEIKQPLAAIASSGDAGLRWLSREAPDIEKARQSIARMTKDAHRAVDIIDRLRGLAKKQGPQKELLDLNAAIIEVTALTEGEAVKTGVTTRSRLAFDLPRIHGDRVQLQQVMLNLIVNAIQAMSVDGVSKRELQISTQTDEAEGVRVGVRDTGPGLAPQSLPRLFEPFYTTKGEGMGMGLAICRSIVEAHGGRLWATACEPHGTLFQFTIPDEQDATS